MDWEQIARTIAPTVATGLLGPLGGVVTSVVGDFLFPPETDKTKLTPQSVMNKIATMTDPEDVAKLRQAELAVQKFEADNNFRFAQLQAESQQSARTMRIGSLASGNRTADSLAWLSMISFLTVAGLVLLLVALALSGVLNFKDHPEVWAAVSGLIGSVLGYFSANANQVVSFYFGSSAGSAAKTDQLAQHASDTLAVLGRIAPTPPAGPTQATAGASVTRVDSTGGTTTTVAIGEPEAQDLAMKAGTAASALAEQR
jgi:hypothetical protein